MTPTSFHLIATLSPVDVQAYEHTHMYTHLYIHMHVHAHIHTRVQMHNKDIVKFESKQT